MGRISLALLSILIINGCATRSMLISEHKDGGRVVVVNSKGKNRRKALADAHKRMLKKCPRGYYIYKKGYMPTNYLDVGRDETYEKYYSFRCKNLVQI